MADSTLARRLALHPECPIKATMVWREHKTGRRWLIVDVATNGEVCMIGLDGGSRQTLFVFIPEFRHLYAPDLDAPATWGVLLDELWKLDHPRADAVWHTSPGALVGTPERDGWYSWPSYTGERPAGGAIAAAFLAVLDEQKTEEDK